MKWWSHFWSQLKYFVTACSHCITHQKHSTAVVVIKQKAQKNHPMLKIFGIFLAEVCILLVTSQKLSFLIINISSFWCSICRTSLRMSLKSKQCICIRPVLGLWIESKQMISFTLAPHILGSFFCNYLLNYKNPTSCVLNFLVLASYHSLTQRVVRWPLIYTCVSTRVYTAWRTWLDTGNLAVPDRFLLRWHWQGTTSTEDLI